MAKKHPLYGERIIPSGSRGRSTLGVLLVFLFPLVIVTPFLVLSFYFSAPGLALMVGAVVPFVGIVKSLSGSPMQSWYAFAILATSVLTELSLLAFVLELDPPPSVFWAFGLGGAWVAVLVVASASLISQMRSWDVPQIPEPPPPTGPATELDDMP